MESEKTFLGRGWSFPPTFNQHIGGVEMVQDELDIQQSLEIFLSTRKGERFMRPDYGNPLLEQVFDTSRTDHLHYLAGVLREAIRRHEPRVLVHRVFVDESDKINGLVHFQVEYEIESTNVRNNIVFPYYLVEGTNIVR